MYVSQPGVGLHLNALETYTGYALFERTARKMVPTERGHLLYQQMQQSLSVLEEIENRFRRKSGKDRPTVSVGMCVETFQQALEKHIPDMDFNLIIQFGESEKLMESLENGGVDLILTTRKKTQNNIHYQPFTSERLVVAAGSKTDLSEWHQLDKTNKNELLQWFHEQLWYNTASDMKLLNQFWEENFALPPGFVPNYIVPNKFSIIRCLSAGKGLAVLPDYLCQEAFEAGQLTPLWCGFQPVENTLYFGKRKNSLNAEQIEQIESMLKSEFAVKA